MLGGLVLRRRPDGHRARPGMPHRPVALAIDRVAGPLAPG